MWYRSYDAPLFRDVVQQGLGFTFGDELMIAFIPPMLFGFFLLGLLCVYFVVLLSMPHDYLESKPVRFLRTTNKTLFWCTIFLSSVSLVVFLGNSKTNVTSGADEDFHLNFLGQYLAMAAAAAQIVVFFGRGSLLKSERAEAAHWKKLVQVGVSWCVVFLVAFAMLQMMSREDISDYSFHRDPYLVRGEIFDWRELDAIAQECGIQFDEDRERDFRRWAKHKYLGESKSGRYFRANVNSTTTGTSIPETPAELRDRLSIVRSDHQQKTAQSEKEQRVLLPQSRRWLSFLMCCTHLPCQDKITAQIFQEAREAHQAQLAALNQFNPEMEKPELTELLLTALDFRLPQEQGAGISAEETTGTHPARPNAEKSVDAWLKDLALTSATDRAKPWPKSRLDRLRDNLTCFLNHQHTDRHGDKISSVNRLETLDQVSLNRDLLEMYGNGMLSPYHDTSTYLVQPHDQQARMRWLEVWLAVLAFGLLGTSRLNRVSYLFDFYRRQISKHFLTSKEAKRDTVHGGTALKSLQPERAGLPYPIYLAAWQKPDFRVNQVNSPRAVVMTPQQITVRDQDHYTCRSVSHLDESLGSRDFHCRSQVPGLHSEITLAQAVAVSGSAVAPQMTNNNALAYILDFFAAIGTVVTPETSQPPRRKEMGLVLVALVLVIAIAWHSSVISLAAALLSAFTICVIIAQILTNAGYPSVLTSFLVQQYKMNSGGSDQQLHPCISATDMDRVATSAWSQIFVLDGGFYDFLGVTELLRRRCELIIVSDAGVNTGITTLESLAAMCERATSNLGIRFVDIDHDSPIDFNRLSRNEQSVAPQPYLAMRVIYPPSDDSKLPKEALLLYAQMAITENDPIEIQQIRHRFPSFPDEPTTNQFYTDDQVAAYRNLGYHIGARVCAHLQRWTSDQIVQAHSFQQTDATPLEFSPMRQPLFSEVRRRLLRSYLQACYEEYYYSEDDVYGESIWRDDTTLVYPSLQNAICLLRTFAAEQTGSSKERCAKAANYWIDQFALNADVSAAYIEAVNYDINRLSNEVRPSKCGQLLSQVVGHICLDHSNQGSTLDSLAFDDQPELLTAHLTLLAVASQQLHRGMPHAIFQVGGRVKLCTLITHLVQDLQQVDMDLRGPLDVAEKVVHEIHEMAESVFQSGEKAAVVSFVQCACKSLKDLLRPNPIGADLKLPFELNTGKYDLILDFRTLLFSRLQAGVRSATRQLIADYLDALRTSPERAPYSDSDSPALIRIVSTAGTQPTRPFS
ncbi:MAG: hypothetical protein R3C53_28200 [Pirellulaceae bacterium]